MIMGFIIFTFIASVCVGLFSILEIIAMHSFSTFFFRIGIPVKRITIEAETANLKVLHNCIIEKSEGIFNFTTDNQVFFLSKLHLFEFFRLITPFPFKAIGTIKRNNKIDINAKIPIGISLLLVLWVVCWSVGAFILSTNSGDFNDLYYGLIGWGFAGLTVLIGYPIGKSRFKSMIVELEYIILHTAHS